MPTSTPRPTGSPLSDALEYIKNLEEAGFGLYQHAYAARIARDEWNDVRAKKPPSLLMPAYDGPVHADPAVSPQANEERDIPKGWMPWTDKDGNAVTLTSDQIAAVQHAVMVVESVRRQEGYPSMFSDVGSPTANLFKSRLLGRLLEYGKPPTKSKPPSEWGGPAWWLLPGGDPWDEPATDDVPAGVPIRERVGRLIVDVLQGSYGSEAWVMGDAIVEAMTEAGLLPPFVHDDTHPSGMPQTLEQEVERLRRRESWFDKQDHLLKEAHAFIAEIDGRKHHSWLETVTVMAALEQRDGAREAVRRLSNLFLLVEDWKPGVEPQEVAKVMALANEQLPRGSAPAGQTEVQE